LGKLIRKLLAQPVDQSLLLGTHSASQQDRGD
jgi:hypothetical protein